MSSERPVRHDLSPALHAGVGVWPGDTILGREVLSRVDDGASVTLSTLHGTVHLGSHADAPGHTVAGAPTIEAVDLDRYLGHCQVMHVDVARGGRVTPADLTGPVDAPRLLLATDTYPDPDSFTTDFAALSDTLVDDLADRGVVLVGIDTPSVDPFPSTDLPAHTTLAARGLAHLEGLVMTDVADGHYELVALPLPLVGFDASPVRAVLRDLETGQV